MTPDIQITRSAEDTVQRRLDVRLAFPWGRAALPMAEKDLACDRELQSRP
ncbi:hypothetical protein LAC81_25760 [Ensifer adhaerens]|nr:hypothetical protein [Ensifer adhaerens]MBZ7927763.1 hypothetical protein [Ensifer adhaerens]UAX96602.1 hypothetical protein LAC78_22725 [Ensifer adhaerens]UAY04054.1 hypothetical protein LAC80_22235 [Ensifer adhaerens]UAY12040.1 hypothetical protein LAC81_25760 [Ensifer adhaerens]